MSVFKKTALLVLLLIMVTGGALFAFGAKEVPEIPPVTSGTQYLSPNDDGIKDDATLKFSVKLYVKSEEGYVPEYGLNIIDPDGNVVAEETKTEKSDVNWFLQIFRGYDEFNLEKEITWDGKDQDGNVLPDGIYKVKVWVKDSSNHTTEIDVDDFVIDTKAPTLALRKPDKLMFSPNNDGIGDVFIILQADGTTETEWTGVFKDSAGKVVKTYTWTDASPEDVLWDGSDDAEGFVPNGTYSYLINSTDLAGNKSKDYTVTGISLDAGAPVFKLDFESTAFSPNGDGVLDKLNITPVYEADDTITDWSWSLASRDGVLIQDAGTAEAGLPDLITLDGLDSDGLPLFPGNYLFSMSVEYRNNWRPVIEQAIVVDIAAPRVEIQPDRYAFSPNGDGLGDIVTVKYRSNEAVTWEGSIIDMTGQVVLETDYTQTTSLVKWDGSGADGTEVPDGEYLVLGVFTDLAGNTTYAEPFTLKIDRRPVNTVLEVPSGFSPNGDGLEDKLKVGIKSDLMVDVREWKMTIIDDTGESLVTYRGEDTLPRTVEWDGMVMQEGNTAPALDGVYQAVIYIDYEKGDFVKVDSDMFVLDINPPKIDMVVKVNPFAKTDTGVEGSVFISVKVEDDRDVKGWEMDVYDENGRLLRTYAGKGNPSGDITWNAADGSVPIYDSGNYTLKLVVTDNGGNTTMLKESLPLDVLLVKKDGKYFVMVPNIIFGAYKYSLDSAGPARYKDNMDSLKRIIELSERYPQYGLILDAHALNIYLGGSREAKEEDILYPLTEKRAEEVKKALIELGLDPERIATEAFGGKYPMVSVTDRNVRWKNRRVEFAVSGLE